MSDEERILAERSDIQREVNNMLLRWIIKILCGIMAIVGAGTGTVAWTGITDHFKLAEMVGKMDVLIKTSSDSNMKAGELSERINRVEQRDKSRITITDAREHDYKSQAALNAAGLKVEWPISQQSP